MTPSLRARRAFTLIELLVVITIIGILAAILFPVFNSVRAKANQVKCMSLLKQWGAVIALYAGDNEQKVYFYAGSGSQPGYMTVGTAGGPTEGPYQRYFDTTNMVQNFRTCPAYRGGKQDVTYGFGRPKVNGKTLAATEFINLLQVTQRSALLLMIDTTSGSKNLNDASALDTYVKPVCIGDSSTVRHSGSANALFADFHVENIPWTAMDRDTPEEKLKCDNWFIVQ